MKVALVHDWLTGMRGGERVLEALASLVPDATIYALFADPAKLSPALRRHRIVTSSLQCVPGIANRYRTLLPLFPLALRALERRIRADHPELVLSVSHCVAKAAHVPGARHVACVLTPMRYAWRPEGYGWKARAAAPVLAWLRRWDRRTSGHLDEVVAISQEVQRRIAHAWGRGASVIYPPVDVERFAPDGGSWLPAPYLVVSALVPYKRVDLAMRACLQLGRWLHVVGDGPERSRLETLAHRHDAGYRVSLFGSRSDSEVALRMQRCRALLFPGLEDFGIVPVEAQAAGRPVIAYGVGGALETVSSATGVLFHPQTVDGMIRAIEKFEGLTFDPEVCRAHAARFGRERFLGEWRGVLGRFGVDLGHGQASPGSGARHQLVTP